MVDLKPIATPDPAILSSPIKFAGRDGREYFVRQLDRKYAARRANALAAIHKLIPYVGDDLEFLHEIGEMSSKLYRWSTSFVVEYSGKTIAFLTSYVRDYSDRHPFRSIYIHRMSVAREHQRNYVGAQLVATALSLYFEAMPWLLTVTVQTNDEPKNAAVLAFYRKCGFKDRYAVEYPHKCDTLMEFPLCCILKPQMLLIISGPSGVGKSRLLDLAERAFGFRRVVPLTTRSSRIGENPGHDYQFVSKEQFCQLISDGRLTAWDFVLGNYYGYGKDLAESVKSGENIVIQALSRMALRIAATYSDVLLVSLRPNSDQILQARLTERSYTSSELALRKAHWQEEIELSHLFNVIIENADITPTAELTKTLADVINRFA
ncbi:MAG TPA: GNAT family N-acetyltransferase [Candidatus Angelobacter sp.]|nr:GNAT family N-acetyltransferase [Candidatus Angelobacter sp.]